MTWRSKAAQENFMWWEQQEGHHTAQGEALWSVPGADTSPGESALRFISLVPVYTDRRNVLDSANLSG